MVDFYNTVESFLQQGEIDTAITYIKNATKNTPNEIKLVIMLGIVYHINEQDDMAYRCFDQALQSDKDNPDSNSWALLTSVAASNSFAEKHLKKLKDVNTPISFAARSNYYASKFDFSQAYSFANSAYKADPSNIEIILTFVRCLELLNRDIELGISILEKSDSLHYDFRVQRLYLKLLFKAGLTEKCEKLAKKYLQQNRDARVSDFANTMLQKIRKNRENDISEVPLSSTRRREPLAHSSEVNSNSLEEALEKLNELIGLTSVKEQIEKLRKKIVFERERAKRLGIDSSSSASYHFVFTGNPGTGKTTVARLLGDIFHYIGILEKGHLVEVKRSDLVGEYQGQTAPKTAAVVKQALGGILFIDEAYSLYNGENDDFGKEAIDTLVKCISDNSDKFIVILAGYTDDMNETLKSNAGLASRFTKYINFPDYTEDELLEIAELIASKAHYTISDDGKIAFKNKISRHMVSNQFGNARVVNNIMNEAFEEKANNTDIDSSDTATLTTLTAIDFGEKIGETPQMRAKKYLNELDELIGLSSVKKDISDLINIFIYQKRESEKSGDVAKPINLHMAFTGNPGTGKTTVARLYGNILREVGLLKKGQFLEVTRADLIASHVGETAKLVKQKCEDAYGGILFIDEAYSLCLDDNDNFGHEAVNTLMTEMENNRHRLAVIFAGYTKEMEEFFAANSGFMSRITNTIEFPDHLPNELLEIFRLYIKKDNYKINDDALDAVKTVLSDMYRHRDSSFGNGRDVRKIYDSCVHSMMIRANENHLSDESRITIQKEDIETNIKQAAGKEIIDKLLDKLNSLIGLNSVKSEMASLLKLIEYNAQEVALGHTTDTPLTLHMIFIGNPGTGKTTVARIYGEILGNLGILKKGHFIEATRADFVGQYQGHTAIKTQKKCAEAYGGILFIDEAYDLCHNSFDSFGMEAVATLIKEMEDNRDNLVVIFAGYSKEMSEFMNTNSGIKSRISKIIDFPDYSTEELTKIFKLLIDNAHMKISDAALHKASELLSEAQVSSGKDFGNGRGVRNMFETVKRNHACRILNSGLSGEARYLIVTEDLQDSIRG